MSSYQQRRPVVVVSSTTYMVDKFGWRCWGTRHATRAPNKIFLLRTPKITMLEKNYMIRVCH